MISDIVGDRVAQVVRGHGGSPPKSLDSDENFKPEHMGEISQGVQSMNLVSYFLYF